MGKCERPCLGPSSKAKLFADDKFLLNTVNDINT